MRRSSVFVLLLALGGCTTMDNAQSAWDIPPDAVAATRLQPNGDEITEYRVAGQLRAVKVQPKRGPAFYLYDRNGDGRVDEDQNISPVYYKLFQW